MNHPLYSANGVYLPLTFKLPAINPVQILVCRWSVTGDEKGAAGQRTATFDTFKHDPDVQALRLIPDEAWDPKQPAMGAGHGVRWIMLSDLHDTLTQDVPVAAIVGHGNTVFVNIMLSATQAHIQRADGSEQNGTTQLYCSLLNFYGDAKVIRWAEDLTRAGRSGVSWAEVKDRCERRQTHMGFADRDYDLNEKGDRVMLNVLTALTIEDDPERRKKLTSKRVSKMANGGAAVSPEQMPRGWVQATNQYGKRIKETDRGFIPVAEDTMMPLFQDIYPRYAAGATFQDLATVLMDAEARGQLVRRDPGNPLNTYQGMDLAETPASRKHDAVQPFFYKKGSRPHTPPTEEQIRAYEGGADPADVFDEETRTYIGRIELIRTGVYFRSLKNDVTGILKKGVDGYVPKPAGQHDEKGTFYIASEPWPWPRNDNGVEVPRFGVSDEVLRQCAARMLRKLNTEREVPRGGRNRGDGSRRLLQNFPGWTTDVTDPVSKYTDGPTAWGVRSRTQNSGKNTISIMHRPGHVTGAWPYLADAASASLAELTADVAGTLESRARQLLDPTKVAAVESVRTGASPIEAVDARLKRLRQGIVELKSTNAGLRQLQAKASQAGDDDRVEELEADERKNRKQIASKEAECANLEQQRRNLEAGEASETGEGNLNLWAFLVVALERASRRHGLGSDREAMLCRETFRDWCFRPDGEGIDWSCNAVITLTDATTAIVPLSGRVRNLRNAAGNQRAVVARYVFAEGRDVDEVAAQIGCRRRAVYDRYVMPALRDAGIESTGAKCGLVDHPFGMVREIAWAAATGRDTTLFPVAPGYLDAVTEFYLDPNVAWGNTTVPDDTTRTQRAVDLLSGPHVDRERGVAVSELALILGCTEEKVRDLARPRHRLAGFVRPRYLEYTSHTKDRVRAILCPHDGEPANHVALFPEVAASGFGVLCRRCRRTPSTDPKWGSRVFPERYVTESYTRAPGRGSIMETRRTIRVAGPLLSALGEPVGRDELHPATPPVPHSGLEPARPSPAASKSRSGGGRHLPSHAGDGRHTL